MSLCSPIYYRLLIPEDRCVLLYKTFLPEYPKVWLSEEDTARESLVLASILLACTSYRKRRSTVGHRETNPKFTVNSGIPRSNQTVVGTASKGIEDSYSVLTSFEVPDQ